MEILPCLLCGVVTYLCHAEGWHRVHKQGRQTQYLCDACFKDVATMAEIYATNQHGQGFLKHQTSLCNPVSSGGPQERRWSNGRLLHPNDALHQSVSKKSGGAPKTTNRQI